MPERSFFDIRSTFPGYAFLLIVISSIAPHAVDLATKELKSLGMTSSADVSGTLTVVLGALFILNGAPIGFLVSQPWYLISKELLLWRNLLVDFQLPDFTKTETIVRADLTLYSLSNRDIVDYIRRRLDLLNTMGSMIIAIIFGCIVSIALWSIDLGISIDFLLWVILLSDIAVGVLAISLGNVWNEMKEASWLMLVSNYPIAL